jgi:hypothetical protein
VSRTNEEIIQALEVLKDVCNESDCCPECPLRADSNECYLESHVPYKWPIKDHEEPWRAFDD